MVIIDKKIIGLYIDKKFSVQQIADLLNISSSKIRYILDQNKIERRNRSEAIRYLNITKLNKPEFKLINNLSNSQERLKLAGAMIYWGEGTKSGNSVVLSNSSPEMIAVFLKFLREVCGISEERLRVVLHYYQNQDEGKLIGYWSQIMKIPQRQFCKSFLHNIAGGSYKTKSQYGTISLRYSDKKLLGVINSWIKEYSEKF